MLTKERFNKWLLFKLESYMFISVNKTGFIAHPTIISKCINNLSIRFDTMNMIEFEIGNVQEVIGMVENFMIQD